MIFKVKILVRSSKVFVLHQLVHFLAEDGFKRPIQIVVKRIDPHLLTVNDKLHLTSETLKVARQDIDLYIVNKTIGV